MVVTVHGPIDEDLYPYYRVLGDEVGLIAISDRQRELAPDLNWVERVHNALRVDEWPFRVDKGDYALFLGRYAPYKGAHLALRAAHQAGLPLVLAGKGNEPSEQAYFSRFLMVASSASPMRISMCHCPGSAGRWKAQWSMPSLNGAFSRCRSSPASTITLRPFRRSLAARWLWIHEERTRLRRPITKPTGRSGRRTPENCWAD